MARRALEYFVLRPLIFFAALPEVVRVLAKSILQLGSRTFSEDLQPEVPTPKTNLLDC